MTSPVRILSSIQAIVATTLLCILAAITTQPAQAQTLTVLHTFNGGLDGGSPAAGLTMDRAGNLYGTTSGYYGNQTSSVFELKSIPAGWLLNPIFTFYPNTQSQGYGPYGKVVFGPDGALYGSARTGGTNICDNQGCGTIFKLQPHPTFCNSFLCEWNITVLYDFSPDSGAFPDQIIFGPDGSIYGTTLIGGNTGNNCPNGCGTVFRLTNSGGTWTRDILYEFSGTDGNYPQGGVVLDSAGNLYGTTYNGGTYNQGVLYKLSPAQGFWTETVLQNFSADGANPVGPLTMDAAGNMYGATMGGYLGVGTVFEMSPGGNLQTLYTIYAAREPQGGLLLDSAGNIYGVQYLGGPDRDGSIYKLTQTNGTWTYTDLYDFHGEPDGQFPTGGLVMDAQGNLYGTCSGGGSNGAFGGTAWKFTP